MLPNLAAHHNPGCAKIKRGSHHIEYGSLVRCFLSAEHQHRPIRMLNNASKTLGRSGIFCLDKVRPQVDPYPYSQADIVGRMKLRVGEAARYHLGHQGYVPVLACAGEPGKV